MAGKALHDAQKASTILPTGGTGMNVRSRLSLASQEQRGQTILMLALMVTALLGFTAIVTDAGIVYWQRRLLQNAVDAAALAGASHLPNDPNAAIQVAVSYAQANGVSAGELICAPGYPYPPGTLTCQAGTNVQFGVQVTQTYSPNDTLIVSAERNIGFGLRYLIGAGNAPVVATAQAIVAVQTPGKIAPVAISIQQPNTAASDGSTPTPCTSPYTECSIKVGAGSGSSGNFQLIDWAKATPGSGACPGGGNTCVMYSFTSGYPGPIATPATFVPGPNGTPIPQWDWDVPTQPGSQADVQKAATQIAAWDVAQECDDGSTCSQVFVTPNPTEITAAGVDPSTVNFYPDTQTNGQDVVCYQYVECPRILVIPIISQAWQDTNGETMVTITNFSCFYLTRVQNGNGQGQMEIDGMFIPTCKSLTGQAWYGVPLSSGGILGNDIGVYLWH